MCLRWEREKGSIRNSKRAPYTRSKWTLLLLSSFQLFFTLFLLYIRQPFVRYSRPDPAKLCWRTKFHSNNADTQWICFVYNVRYGEGSSRTGSMPVSAQCSTNFTPCAYQTISCCLVILPTIFDEFCCDRQLAICTLVSIELLWHGLVVPGRPFAPENMQTCITFMVHVTVIQIERLKNIQSCILTYITSIIAFFPLST